MQLLFKAASTIPLALKREEFRLAESVSVCFCSPLVGMCTAAECLVVCAVLNINWESVEDLSPK